MPDSTLPTRVFRIGFRRVFAKPLEASQSTHTIEQQVAKSEEPVSRVNAEEATEAVNVPAGAPIAISDDDYDPVSADDMELWKASKLSNPRETEPDESEVQMTPSPPVQGVYDDGGQDAAAAAVPTEEPARDPDASIQLTEGVLDKIPSVEGSTEAIERWRTSSEVSHADEESWVEVGGEIHGDAETGSNGLSGPDRFEVDVLAPPELGIGTNSLD